MDDLEREPVPGIPLSLAPFRERLEAIFGMDRAARILATMAAPKRVGFFVNPLRESVDEAPGIPVAGLPGCRSVAAGDREELLGLDAVTRGGFYPMNPSSVLAVRHLDVAGAEEVLDLAAAPGGKTLLMAAAMGNGGRIAAVEPVKARFHRMRANLDRCGVTNVQFYQADGRSIGRKVPERFDRVLLDAPCSSEARIRIDEPETFAHWKLRKIRECARKQRGLVRSAYAALKPGGRLLYCTCSFAPEENEMVVDYLLDAAPDARLVRLEGAGIPGLTAWQGRTLDSRLSDTLRVVPDDLYDGFYMALIGKP